MALTKLSLALQGGGSHGAFTWGVLDRVLAEAHAGRFEIAAISGTSAGAINAAVTACALAEGGPELARNRLAELWQTISTRGFLSGNGVFFASPGPFGFNIDWSPAAIALEALDLVVSPYANPFYTDPLGPLLKQVLPPERLRFLEAPECPRVFLTATNVATDERTIFTQPEISIDTIRASCCLPTEFRAVRLGDEYFWDGGYLGNPALAPLVDCADDLLLILANPLRRSDSPPTNARTILDRLNEIMFNASVVLEINAIEAINRLLEDLRAKGLPYEGRYRPIHLHAIRNDEALGKFGVESKNSTSWPLLAELNEIGRRTADRFFAHHADSIGQRSSSDVKRDLTRPVLRSR